MAATNCNTPSERITMYPGNYYVVREATPADEPTLRRLAELDSQRPLSGPALIGERGGVAAAALSAGEGRVVADPFQATALPPPPAAARAARRRQRPARHRTTGGDETPGGSLAFSKLRRGNRALSAI
jgi:hypothetical protein